MTLDETILLTKYHVRNFFNQNNSESEPPEPSPKYSLFLTLCGEIHAAMNSPEWKVSPYTSETVLGLHSWTKATGADGQPISLLDAYSARLRPFTMMTYRS